MFGIYTPDPSKPVPDRLAPLPRTKEDLDPDLLADLLWMFQGAVHPDPVQNFLTYFSGLDSSSEGEFVLAKEAADFGLQDKLSAMMHDGAVSQVNVWLAALYGAFNATPPTEYSPVTCVVTDDDTVNPPELVNAGYFRRDVSFQRTIPDTRSLTFTFLINRNPEL